LCLGGGLVALPGLQVIGIALTDTQLLVGGILAAAAGGYLLKSSESTRFSV